MSKRKLLLADDSATIQKVVNLTFADEGIEVAVVADGNAAMKKIVENAPDLILADVNLPGAGGYEICDFIKRDEATRHILVILLVGSLESFDEEKARGVGADDYMTKPFQSIRQLVTKVSGLLNNADDAPVSDGSTKQAAAGADTAAETSVVSAAADAHTDAESPEAGQIGSLPVVEAEEFSSRLSDETSSGTSSGESTAEEDRLRTPAPVADERTETDLTGERDSDDSSPDDEKIYVVADEDVIEEKESEDYQTSDSDNISEHSFAAAQSYGRISEDDAADDSMTGTNEESAENLPVNPPTNPFAGIELDEMNLLELSFDDDEFYESEDEPIEESGLAQFVEAAETVVPESSGAKISYMAREFHTGTATAIAPEQEIYAAETPVSTADSRASFENISPALIEAIATRVIEKLSDRVIREIAAEVVPQMADAIIQQMARDEFDN